MLVAKDFYPNSTQKEGEAIYKFWQLNSNWIRPVGKWIRHFGYWIRSLGYWIRHLGNWIRRFGTKIRHDWIGFKKPATHLWMNLFRRVELHLRSKAVTGAGKRIAINCLPS